MICASFSNWRQRRGGERITINNLEIAWCETSQLSVPNYLKMYQNSTFVWQGFGHTGIPGVASVRSFVVLQSQGQAAPSQHLVAPLSQHVQKWGKGKWTMRLERGVRVCEKNNSLQRQKKIRSSAGPRKMTQVREGIRIFRFYFLIALL